MSRRSPGDGSIYPTPDGSGWIAALSVPSRPGQRRRRIKRRARTKTEAKQILRELRDEVSRSRSVSLDAKRRVSDAVDDYLALRRAQPLEPRTLDKDEWAAKLVRAGIGDVRLTDLGVEDCDQFLAAVAAGEFGRPVARAQLRRLRQKLSKMIENDLRRGLVARNVAQLAVIPDESPELVPRRQPRAITMDEVNRLIAVASGVMAVLIDLSARNGLRPAEARGLRWSRVDVASRTLRVDAQMNRLNELAKPKTARSRRAIRFDAKTADRLERWRQLQAEQQAAADVAWLGNPEGLIATSLRGSALNQRNVHRSIVKACAKAGVEPAISGYDLRHTAITLQVERGLPVHKIADWAGTSERMIADVYRHKLELVTDLGSIE